jgi:peptidyl-prolyl cis-trans isomerase A (cyclophilin A)
MGNLAPSSGAKKLFSSNHPKHRASTTSDMAELCRRLYFQVLMAIFAGSLFLSCRQPKPLHPHVIFQSRLGDIEVELYEDKAPLSVAAFLRCVDSGYYKNASFYRVLSEDNQPIGVPKAELIQGGMWASKKRLDSIPAIPHESTQATGLSHLDGTLSLARQDTGTATTEFFICIGDQPGFNYGGENNPDGQGYAAFGRVVKGMKVAKFIYVQNETDQYFRPPVIINNIVRKK